MNWNPVWDVMTAVERTALWYKTFYESGKVKSREDLHMYIEDARCANIPWVKE
jgi:CDP-glucose 4,6-dehydratase